MTIVVIVVVTVVAVEVVSNDNSCDCGGNSGDSSVISCPCCCGNRSCVSSSVSGGVSGGSSIAVDFKKTKVEEILEIKILDFHHANCNHSKHSRKHITPISTVFW